MFLKRFQFRLLLIPFLMGTPPRLLLSTAAAQPAAVAWADTLTAENLIRESAQLNRQDKHEAALEKARQAFAIFSQLYGDNHPKTARARMYVAREYRNFNREQEAIDLFAQSLRVYETAGDTFRIALCHHNLSLCLRQQHRYGEAMQHALEAIALIQPDSAKQASFIADFTVNVGSILNAEKKYHAAIPILESCKSVYTSQKNARALGEVSYHLGGAWYGVHDYTRAKEHYLGALANLKHELTPAHSYFADLYVKIGLCCQKTGEPETGLKYLLEARDAYVAAGVEDLNYIQFLQYLGQFYLDERQYAAAIEQLESCLSAKEQRYGGQSALSMGTLQVLAEAYLQAGRYGLAEAGYRRLLRIAADSLDGRYPLAYRFYGKLAEIKLAQGDIAGSLSRCDTAFAVAGFDPKHPERVLPRDYTRELCQLYARTLLEQYRQNNDTATLQRAERYFALAGETLFREVEEITVNSSREVFYDNDYPVLEQWLDARMRLFDRTGDARHAEAAFQIAGQSKAFLLSAAMRQSGALRYAGVPDSILQNELRLREQIVDAEKTLDANGRRNSTQTDSSQLALNHRLSTWREEYDALLHRIAGAFPDYFSLRFQHRNISSTDLAHRWLAPGQALLMFSQSSSGLCVFVLTRDTLHLQVLPGDYSTIDEEVERFRHCLGAYFETPDPDDALYDRYLDTYTALAQALYQKLVAPVAGLLPERVIIIPEGKLCYLPFEALLSSAPAEADNFRTYPFWTRTKAISYALSTDYLVETAAAPVLNAQKTWLGLAPFAEAPDNKKTAARLAQPENFPPLPFSGKEVRDIAALLQGEAWLGAEARPGRFQAAAPLYRILHLATHSRADDRLGDYSYLAAAQSGAPMPAKDLYQMTLAAGLVVLSACESGGGKLLRGEGIIGLVRAFTYAGARSVVASIWVANDQSTATLMVDFYRNLKKGLPKDLALKAARISLFDRTPGAGHPFFWAGFRVYGSVAPVF